LWFSGRDSGSLAYLSLWTKELCGLWTEGRGSKYEGACYWLAVLVERKPLETFTRFYKDLDVSATVFKSFYIKLRDCY
jgi:hypothetical protein